MLKRYRSLIALLCFVLFISSCSVVTDEPDITFFLKDAPYGLTAVIKDNAEGFVSIYVDDYVFDTAFNKSDYTFENKLNLSWRALPEEQQKKIGSLQTLIDSFTYLTGKPQHVKSDLAANVYFTIVSDRNKMLAAGIKKIPNQLKFSGVNVLDDAEKTLSRVKEVMTRETYRRIKT